MPPTTEDVLQSLLQSLNQLNQSMVRIEHRLADQDQALLQAQAEQVNVQAQAKAQDPELQEYWVRMKPYNEHRGHLRRRQYLNELGRCINGGTGAPGDIPEWVGPFPYGQALEFAKYHQNDNDPNSPRVFDIVTAEQRQEIDAAEQMMRMSALGVAGAPPSMIMNKGRIVAASSMRQQPPVLRLEPPSMAKGAEQYMQHVNQLQDLPSVPAPPGQQPKPVAAPAAAPGRVRSGRAAALQDLPTEGFEGRDGVEEDLTEAAVDDGELAATIAAVSKRKGRSTVKPK